MLIRELYMSGFAMFDVAASAAPFHCSTPLGPLSTPLVQLLQKPVRCPSSTTFVLWSHVDFESYVALILVAELITILVEFVKGTLHR